MYRLCGSRFTCYERSELPAQSTLRILSALPFVQPDCLPPLEGKPVAFRDPQPKRQITSQIELAIFKWQHGAVYISQSYCVNHQGRTTSTKSAHVRLTSPR